MGKMFSAKGLARSVVNGVAAVGSMAFVNSAPPPAQVAPKARESQCSAKQVSEVQRKKSRKDLVDASSHQKVKDQKRNLGREPLAKGTVRSERSRGQAVRAAGSRAVPKGRGR